MITRIKKQIAIIMLVSAGTAAGQECPVFSDKQASSERTISCMSKDPGTTCTVTPTAGYSCTGDVTCVRGSTTSDWQNTVACDKTCDGQAPPSPISGVTFDCSLAKKKDESCVVNNGIQNTACSEPPVCKSGNYDTSSFSCGCSHPGVNIDHAGYTCPSPFTDIDETCTITPNPGHSCLGVLKCNSSYEWVNTISCHDDCSGTYNVKANALFTADCSNAKKHNTTCDITIGQGTTCPGALRCLDGAYEDKTDCFLDTLAPIPTPADTDPPDTPSPRTNTPTPTPVVFYTSSPNTPIPDTYPPNKPPTPQPPSTNVPTPFPPTSPPQGRVTDTPEPPMTGSPPTPQPPMTVSPLTPSPPPTPSPPIVCGPPPSVPNGELLCNVSTNACRLVPVSPDYRCRVVQAYKCNPGTQSYEGNGTCFEACQGVVCSGSLKESCREWVCKAGLCMIQDMANSLACENDQKVAGTCNSGVCVVQEGSTCATTCDYGSDQCFYMTCVDGKCIKKTRSGWDCTVNQIHGICDTAGKCVKLTSLTTDCSTLPCDKDKTCFDPDGKVNGEYTCTCLPETAEDTSGACVASSTVCNIAAAAACSKQYKDCQVEPDGSTTCVDRPCPGITCPKLPPGCSYQSDGKVDPYDGCPADPCHYVCTSGCSADGEKKCQREARTSSKRLICTIEQGTETCTEMSCPTPRCREPPIDCSYYADLDAKGKIRMDTTGCPINPCGIEVCRPSCAWNDRALCAVSSPRKDCTINAAGEPECVEFKCPTTDCSQPPSGCVYTTIKGGTPMDVKGCPIYPCGMLDCSTQETCTEDQRKQCVLQNKACIPSGAGQGVCVGKECPMMKQACTPSLGCTFSKDIVIGQDGCPVHTCGKEICTPINLCETITCTAPLVCKVLQSGPKCVNHGDDDLCELLTCPHGTSCHLKDIRTAMCIDTNEVNCGGCINSQKCVSVLKPSLQITSWQCIAPSECRDACSCSGRPCSSLEQCTLTNDGKSYECLLRTAPTEQDLCSQIVCSPGYDCLVMEDQTSCQPRSQCPVCNATSHCENGRCVPNTCTQDCASTETCMSVDSNTTTCIANDLCKEFSWPPEEGVCTVDADCSSGMVCPSFSNAVKSGLVSKWCECNPDTGKPWKCVNSVFTDHRYCVPEIWACKEGTITGEEENEWCCNVRGKHCGTFHCKTSPYSGEQPENWTDAKKKACCEKTGVLGCPTTKPYDCTTTEEWTAEKVQWCCVNEKLGCPIDTFDCSGSDTSAWSELKNKWCCVVRKKGCRNLPTPVYNCSTAEVFSSEKKGYCCANFGFGCFDNKPVQNCPTSDASQWTTVQREYCCDTVSRGCEGDNATQGPFDCTKNANNQSSVEKDWCCTYRGVCETPIALSCSTRPTNTQSQQDCCRLHEKWCEYECPADPYITTNMASGQKTYCCNVKGVGCGASTPPNPAGSKNWRVYRLTLTASWNKVVRNPKRFLEKFAVTLQAVTEVGSYMRVLQTGPLNDDGDVPEEFSPRGEQLFRFPEEWTASDSSDSSGSDEEHSNVRQSTVMGGSPSPSDPVYKELGTENKIFVDFTMDAPAEVFDKSDKNLVDAVMNGKVNKGPLSQSSRGTTYVIGPYGSQPLTVLENGDSSGGSGSGAPWWIFIIIGCGVMTLPVVVYFAVMRKARAKEIAERGYGEQPGKTFADVHTQDFEMHLVANSYNATATNAQTENKKIIETGNI
eukprot:TRINITY_DN14727_c0_g1_i1.p1 TRINITY_DN14727_c0_g1~~TRINITY_DN14727_c0_g1_i1.p1  ORF type:complete len:1703 (+),score=259.30 TRINITY_DN14727_c0_g1_i1:92-5200(+)